MTYPTLAPEPDTDADATFRNWMRLNLARAATKFGLSVTGEFWTGIQDATTRTGPPRPVVATKHRGGGGPSESRS